MENNKIQNEQVEETTANVPAQDSTNTSDTIDKVADATVKVGKAVVKTGVKVAAAGGKAALGGVFSAMSPLLMKVLIGVALAGVLAGAGGALVNYIKESDALRIADTPNIVQNIKKIAEFTTYTYIEEFVINEEKYETKEASAVRSLFNKDAAPDSLHKQIVLITRGVVRAGYDLNKIAEADLVIKKDTISVKLPAPEVFDVIINPTDNSSYHREGTWSHEEVTELQVNCKNALLENAIASGILEHADKSGKEKIENLFKTFGFSVVEIKK